MEFNILLVDNYDSFTYNLVQYFGKLGCNVTVWRNDQFSIDDVKKLNPDGIVVSPGPCTPTQAGQSVSIIRELGSSVPILGVCLGHQSIGEAYGAKVERALRPVHGKTSTVQHSGENIFSGLPENIQVTRYHSLIVRSLPPCLEAVAFTQDPEEEVIMAMKHTTHPVYGVQFHPESIETQFGLDMLSNFLEIVKNAGRQA